MIKPLAVIAIISTFALSNPFHIKRDILLPTHTIDKNNRSFNSVGMYFTKTSSDILIDLDINLNANETIIADKQAFTWGLECNTSNDCKVQSDDVNEDFCYHVQYFYKQALAYIRPSQDSYSADQTIPALPIRLMQKSDRWITPNWGSLGLGPQGDFANYLRGLYNENFKILLYFYRSKDHDSHFDYINYSVIAPTIEKKNYIDKIPFEINARYWNVSTGIKLGEKVVANNASTCLTNYGNNVLYLINADQFCDDIKQQICNGKIGKDCTKDVADFSKAPEITFTIQGMDYPIKYKQYIKNSNDKVIHCRFGQVFELRGAVNCAPDTEYELSKGFFEMMYP